MHNAARAHRRVCPGKWIGAFCALGMHFTPAQSVPLGAPNPELLLVDLPPSGTNLLPERPGEDRPSLPQIPIPEHPTAQPPVSTEAVPLQNPVSASGLKVHVTQIRIQGNTVFTEAELKSITTRYEGREITSDDLESLRQELTQYYVDHGYVSSGAIIPDQNVKNGVVEVQIIEAKLAEIELSGNKWLRDRYIKSRLLLGDKGPVNIRNLQERIRLLHEDPLVDRVEAQLTPGLQRGENVLRVAVKESRPYELSLTFDNHRSPSVGELRGQLYGAMNDITGFGDSISVRYGLTEGLQDYGVNYSLPITARDTRLRVYFDKSDSTVIEKPFDTVDIKSDNDSHGIEISQPFLRTPNSTLTAGALFERRTSETSLLGLPFSFSEGPHDGLSKISALRFWQEFVNRQPDQAIATRSTFSVGVDAFGITRNTGDTPDGEFFTWLGQFQWVRRLPWHDTQALFRTDVQLSPDALLPLEQFGVGGAATVRGYRENALVRDNGVVSSLEFRIPVFRLPVPRLSQSPEDGMVRLAPFIDGAWTSNNRRATPDPEFIWSAGLGLRWDPHPKLHSELYWGHAFKEVDTGGEDKLQDEGIHFQLYARLF